MLSSDVCSLFTNIPNDLVCKNFDRRWTDIHSKCKIPFDEIVNITNFLFDNTYFVFNEVFYKQIFGTHILVMDDLENDCLINLKNEYNCIPLPYYRYIDDTLLIVKKEHVEIVLRV